MPIIRIAKRETPYVQIDRRCLEDDRLTWRARGLLAYLLAKPDNWQIRREDLLMRSPDGLHTVRESLRELEQAGYLRRDRVQDAAGRFRYEHLVFEIPLADIQPTVFRTEPDANPQVTTENPSDLPLVEIPLAVNQPSSTKDKKEEVQEEAIERKAKTLSRNKTREHPRFEAFWSAYPRHIDRSAALRCFQRLTGKGIDPETLVAAASHYAAFVEEHSTEPQFVLYGSTFLGPQARWRDFADGIPQERAATAPKPRGFAGIEAFRQQREAHERARS